MSARVDLQRCLQYLRVCLQYFCSAHAAPVMHWGLGMKGSCPSCSEFSSHLFLYLSPVTCTVNTGPSNYFISSMFSEQTRTTLQPIIHNCATPACTHRCLLSLIIFSGYFCSIHYYILHTTWSPPLPTFPQAVLLPCL